MKRPTRLWICGVCQNNEEELTEILDPLSGFILCEDDHDYCLRTLWVDGGSHDECDTLAVIAKYGGTLLHRKWTNDHDFQMNEYLRSGHIHHGDWVIQLDTSERINPKFIQKLQNGMLKNFEEQNINMVYQRSKPLLFKWHDDQIFLGSPHWGLQSQRRHIVDISKFDGFQDDKTYVWSLRDDINKWIVNGIKYYLAYGRSNHMWLIYSEGNYPGSAPSLIHEHEEKRLRFRNYCRSVIQLPFDSGTSKLLSAFDDYLKAGEFDEEFVYFMNYEKVIANYYRYVSGEDQKLIYDTQNTWQF